MNFSSFSWKIWVSRRFSRVEKRTKSAATVLATMAIAAGVAALVVVLSVMNGFQFSYVKSILAVDSYHVQARNISADDAEKLEGATCAVPFFQAQGLLSSDSDVQRGAVIRAVPADICAKDADFACEAQVVNGEFDLSENNSIVLGADLAYFLNAEIGSEISIFALSGNSEVDLFSDDRKFFVTGIFSSGYNQINANMAFVSDKNAERLFGKSASPTVGIKLASPSADSKCVSLWKKSFPKAQFSSWREFNKSFYSALRLEKNTLFLVALMIFAVVAVNIYHALRRLVYDRREEIAVLSALGARKNEVRAIFSLRGLEMGIFGASVGAALGVLICKNIEGVFMFLAFLSDFFANLALKDEFLVSQPSSFLYFAKIPAHIIPAELAFIALFAVFSTFFAADAAGRQILKIPPAEVLRDE